MAESARKSGFQTAVCANSSQSPGLGRTVLPVRRGAARIFHAEPASAHRGRFGISDFRPTSEQRPGAERPARTRRPAQEFERSGNET